MPYCTQDDILLQLDEETLILLTDDDAIGAVDDAIVTRCIADADEEIDSALAVRYTLPFADTPALVRKLSVDLAICNLYGRRLAVMPEERKARCGQARDMLDKFARGLRSLDVPEPDSKAGSGAVVSTKKSDRIFSRGRASEGSSGSLDNY
ncbi:MAG: DUF1320 domain-containing protein [Desulfobacterium sp.]|nr:DUF1320 domain-containing protein [Desulfobacteraceae bacterium]MBA3036771.1 DUF1320 domain-containing protein [Desulfobacterium sp.]